MPICNFITEYSNEELIYTGKLCFPVGELILSNAFKQPYVRISAAEVQISILDDLSFACKFVQ